VLRSGPPQQEAHFRQPASDTSTEVGGKHIQGTWAGTGPYQTPHFDALAKASIRPGQHYSLLVYSPSRSALLSGRFNFRLGCTNSTNDRVYPFATTTLTSAEPLPSRDHSATLKVRAVSSVPHVPVYRRLL
jgi:hypothetical protein